MSFTLRKLFAAAFGTLAVAQGFVCLDASTLFTHEQSDHMKFRTT